MSTETITAEHKSVDASVSLKAVDGERTVIAVVSSSKVDRDGEIVDVTSLRLPLKGGGYVLAKDLTGDERVDIPMLLNHSFDVEDVIGSVRKAYIVDGELVVEFGISSRAKAKDLLTLIDEGHLDNAFSITMFDYTYDTTTKTIYDAEIAEISLVFRGSNKDARLLAVKSLISKGDSMDKPAIETEVERLKRELAEAEAAAQAADAEAVTTDKPVDEVTPDVAAAEAAEKPAEEAGKVEPEEVKEEAKAEEAAAEPEESKTIKIKEEKTMDKIATKQVVDAPDVAPTVEVVGLSKDAQRSLFVEQFMAAVSKSPKLKELNKKAFEADRANKKILGEGTVGDVDLSNIYQTEVVSSDIREAYTNEARLGRLVNNIDILGAEKWKALHLVDGDGFQPVGLGGDKPEDQLSFTPALVIPHEHAVIVAWYDAIARKTPLAVYNEVVKYIAKQYARLEDKIILSFAGGTHDGEVYEVTGLQPLLTAASRVVSWNGTAATLVPKIGSLFAMIKSDEKITFVANRTSWANMATLVDADGRALFTQVGNTVNVGALGSFEVVLSDEVAAGMVVAGAFGDYDLVTRGGLETLFSREATVGTVNLFVNDASALRANADISGAPRNITSFAMLDNTTVS